MPASLFGDMDHHGGLSHMHHHHLSTPVSSSANTSCSSGIGGSGSLIDDDQRALQLALELSMLGLSDGGSLASLHQLAASVGGGNDNHHSLHNMMHHHHQQQQHHHQMHHNQLHGSNSDIYGMVNGSDMLPKKSQNMTECVPVPSSEHVAEIVGRQGKKSWTFTLSLVLFTFSFRAKISHTAIQLMLIHVIHECHKNWAYLRLVCTVGHDMMTRTRVHLSLSFFNKLILVKMFHLCIVLW